MRITEEMKKDGAYIIDVMLKGIESRPGNTNCFMPEDALEIIAGRIIEKAFAQASQSQKRFPMQRGPDIDWTTAEKIYAVYSALYGKQQSLERLAERGGFSWPEVEVIFKEGRKQGITAIK